MPRLTRSNSLPTRAVICWLAPAHFDHLGVDAQALARQVQIFGADAQRGGTRRRRHAERAMGFRRTEEIHRWAADEAADKMGCRLAIDLVRRRVLHDLAADHHGDAVGQPAHRFGRSWVTYRVVVFQLAQQALQFAAHLQAQQRVEVGQRLVHQQHVGLHRERTRHRHALTLAARQLAGVALEQDSRCASSRRRA